MGPKYVIQALIELRQEWLVRLKEPEYMDRLEWLRGLIHGIELAIRKLSV